MKKIDNSKYIITVVSLLAGFFYTSNTSMAQEVSSYKAAKTGRRKWSWVSNGNFYVSWGYNKEWYSKSTVEVDQFLDGIGTAKYKLVDVNGQDKPVTDILNAPVTIPQYSARIGYFFNEDQDLGIELNFDHTKYKITNNQLVHVKGLIGTQFVDTNVIFSEPQFRYQLNNGANFVLLNLMKRFNLSTAKDNSYRLDYILKCGIGPVVPHVSNTFFGYKTNEGFQIGGWNTAVEAQLRATFGKYIFIDFSQKLDYARYSNIRVYKGRARQSFFCYEIIGTVGINIPHLKKSK